ncbi:hypothetical protein MUN84_10920 [Hymenobacter sp. 5516J-16]|uniref:DUF6624 domain-containing protein n=1 Tax=Hymenobacter sp. 5516J-16 TaxID=2932253 RepID=UPI001FD2A532|nr:DUF6624 domain-containing protein [Hymenobacter sp. 5516J-16]UOQ78981.1 hypothetical protein MUN84_10920 [Hymenobacter sp. 5516J-16]
MKKTFLLLGALLISSSTLLAQADFGKLKQRASDAYATKDYKASGQYYDQALKQSKAQLTSGDYYNAACSWALAGDATKAFQYLDRATLAGWENVAHTQQDTDLTALHTDKRWQPMLTKMQAALAKTEANYNKPLKQQLDSIYASDQSGRMKHEAVEKQYGQHSPEMTTLWKDIEATDARNLQRITTLLDTHGWPTKAAVGNTGTTTVFLVIQHSDLATQQKYFPMAKQAAERGDLSKSALALLQDRILIGQGKPQLYGSQLHTDPTTGKTAFSPIEDEAHVDERRAALGMEPLASYAKRFGLEYKPPVK